MDNSPPCNSYPTNETLPAFHYYRYCYSRCSDEVHSLVPPVQTFNLGPVMALGGKQTSVFDKKQFSLGQLLPQNWEKTPEIMLP